MKPAIDRHKRSSVIERFLWKAKVHQFIFRAEAGIETTLASCLLDLSFGECLGCASGLHVRPLVERRLSYQRDGKQRLDSRIQVSAQTYRFFRSHSN